MRIFSRFWVVRRIRETGLLMAWVRTEGILLDELGALSNGVGGRLGKWMEEVIRLEQSSGFVEMLGWPSRAGLDSRPRS